MCKSNDGSVVNKYKGDEQDMIVLFIFRYRYMTMQPGLEETLLM